MSISHGMGVPSIGILLHEVIKLMYHAKCKDPVFVRIGTCGGVGIEGGTVVVSDGAVDGLLRDTYEMVRESSDRKLKTFVREASRVSLEHNFRSSLNDSRRQLEPCFISMAVNPSLERSFVSNEA